MRVVRLVRRFKNNAGLRFANKRKQENQKRKVFLSGKLYWVTARLLSTLKRPGMNCFLNTHTQSAHTKTTWRSTTSPSSKQQLYQHQISTAFLSEAQTEADEINVLRRAAAAKEMKSGNVVVVVVCVQKKKNIIWKTSKIVLNWR